MPRKSCRGGCADAGPSRPASRHRLRHGPAGLLRVGVGARARCHRTAAPRRHHRDGARAGRRNPLAAYRLLLKRFFQHVAVAARPDRDKTHGMIAPRRNTLPSLLATARATQTGIVLAAQNVMQFGNENERSCVFDACDTALILPDASAASVAQFHARLGHREVRRQAVSREFGRSRGPVSVSGESGDVLGSRKIMEPPFGRFPAFLHSSSDGVGAVAIELDHLTVSACDR